MNERRITKRKTRRSSVSNDASSNSKQRSAVSKGSRSIPSDLVVAVGAIIYMIFLATLIVGMFVE